MRALLVTYEFPPSASPHGIRSRELAMGLVRLGWEVLVLTPTLPAGRSCDTDVPGLVVHRSFAGPLTGSIASLAALRAAGRSPGSVSDGSDGCADGAGAARDLEPGRALNWKGRVVEILSRIAGRLVFPDVRGEWNPWARAALRKLLPQFAPDVVVCFHEPASALELGRFCRRRGFPVVADLGDPVLAAYTPHHWRQRAGRLEQRVCAELDQLVVTTAAARELLRQRHGLDGDRCTVVSQGFVDYLEATSGQVQPDTAGPLRLLYAGRLYDFRRPDELLAAVEDTPGVELQIVSPSEDPACDRAARRVPGRIIVSGALPHHAVLSMQRRADVLLSIGNQGMPAQTPGKVYEHLGSGRPTLHLSAGEDDPSTAVIEALGSGWVCDNSREAIRSCLLELASAKARGALGRDLRLDSGQVAEHGWSRLSQRFSDVLRRAAGMPA